MIQPHQTTRRIDQAQAFTRNHNVRETLSARRGGGKGGMVGSRDKEQNKNINKLLYVTRSPRGYNFEC